MLTYDEVAAVAEAVEARLVTNARRLSTGDERQLAFPGSTVSLIAPNEHGELEVAQARWGFEAPWSRKPSKLVFNTRVESALEGAPFWRDAAENGRCIVPVATFFEPHATETVRSPRTGRPMKRPYEFADPDGWPLLLAGLQADGCCSIVTCEPNRWVAPVHDRMPLVMRFREATTWLSPDWPALADRSGVELGVRPEQLQPAKPPDQPDQLSLF